MLTLQKNCKIATQYFPLGAALELSTNSAAIADTASRLWDGYPRLFGAPAIRVDVFVSPDRAAAPRTP